MSNEEKAGEWPTKDDYEVIIEHAQKLFNNHSMCFRPQTVTYRDGFDYWVSVATVAYLNGEV